MDLTFLRGTENNFIYEGYCACASEKEYKKAMKKAKAPSLNRNRTFIVDKNENDVRTTPNYYCPNTEAVPESGRCARAQIANVELIELSQTSTQVDIKTVIQEQEVKNIAPTPVNKTSIHPKLNELPERHYSAPNICIQGEYENDFENEYIYSGCYSGLRSNDIDSFQNCVNIICSAFDQNKGDIEFGDIEIIQCADALQYNSNRTFDQANWLYSLHNNTNNIRITEIDTEPNSDEVNKTKSNTSSSDTDHDTSGNNGSAPPYIRVPTPSPMYVPKLNLDVTQTLPTVVEMAEGKSSVNSIDSSVKSKASAITLNNWMKQGQAVIKHNEDKSTNVTTWLSKSLGGDTRLKSANSTMSFDTEMNETESRDSTEANNTVAKQSCHSQTECNEDDKSFDSHVNQMRLMSSKASQTANLNMTSSDDCLFDSTRVAAARPIAKSLNNSWVNEFNDSIENQKALETSLFTAYRGKLSQMSACSTESAQSGMKRRKQHKESFWNRFVHYFIICK